MTLRIDGPVLVIGDLVVDVLIQSASKQVYAGDTSGQIRFLPGGSAANQAVWLARLGMPVLFAGQVGDDPLGHFLVEDLRREGVEPRVSFDPDHATGSVALMVDAAGERSMITSRTANARLDMIDSPGAPSENLSSLLDGVRHVQLSGYGLVGQELRDKTCRVIEECLDRGTPVSMDPSSHSLLAKELEPDEFFRLTRGLEILFPSLEEGRYLTGLTEPLEVAEALLQYYPLVILKLGREGSLIGTQLVPTNAVKPLDTTGAGDAFCAAFLAAYLSGSTPVEAARQANALARLVVQHKGARPTLPDMGTTISSNQP